jgi:endonuclease YncB( thermonuclease family)
MKNLQIFALVASFATAMAGCATSDAKNSQKPLTSPILSTFNGTIASASDGDTVKIKAFDGQQVVVRLSDIDAPETYHAGPPAQSSCAHPKLADRPGQPGGQEAKRLMRSLVPVGTVVTVECFETDKYERQVCHVRLQSSGVYLHQAMLQMGGAMTVSNPAWVRDSASRGLEAKARTQGLGIWASKAPIHPDEWRRQCWCDGNCPNGVYTLTKP